jgi:hypothetical protein
MLDEVIKNEQSQNTLLSCHPTRLGEHQFHKAFYMLKLIRKNSTLSNFFASHFMRQVICEVSESGNLLPVEFSPS